MKTRIYTFEKFVNESITSFNEAEASEKPSGTPISVSAVTQKLNSGITKGTKFNFQDILSKAKTQRQGYSGPYYWEFLPSGSDLGNGKTSVYDRINIWTFPTKVNSGGALRKQYSIIKDTNSSLFHISSYPNFEDKFTETAPIYYYLKKAIVENPVDRLEWADKINQEEYFKFLENYVNSHPDSIIAGALKNKKEDLRPISVGKYKITQKEVDEIKKNELYKKLQSQA